MSATPTNAPNPTNAPTGSLPSDAVASQKLNAYLDKFPQGTFAELARSRLAELKTVPIAPSPKADPKLLEALSIAQASALPTPKAREDYAVGYQAAPEHKALAAYLSAAI